MFLFLSFYMQRVLGYDALQTGVHFLPFSIGIILTAGIVARVLPKVGPRPLMIGGLIVAAFGMALLLRTTPEDQYWTHVFPSLVIIPIGMAFVFIPTSSTALIGVNARDAGVASALLNTSQQVGGSIGLALLSTLALSAQRQLRSRTNGEDPSNPSAHVAGGRLPRWLPVGSCTAAHRRRDRLLAGAHQEARVPRQRRG